MFKSSPSLVLGVAICAFLMSLSSSSAEIDFAQLDASVFREHDLFEVALELAVEFPSEVSEMMMQAAEVVYGSRNLGYDDTLEPFTIIDQLRNASRCAICTQLLRVFGLLNEDAYLKVLNIIIAGCETVIGEINKRLNQQPFTRVDIKADPLCSGTVMLQGPRIKQVLESGGRLNIRQNVEDFCENINQCIPPASSTASSPGTRLIPNDPDASDAEEFVVSEKPANAQQQSRILNREDYITIAQLTDIHIEPEYVIGSPKDCGLPVCCTNKWNENSQGKARPFGEYTCNIPQRTMEQFLKKVEKMNPDIVLFSGDIPPSSVWEETQESQYNCTRILTRSIQTVMPGRVIYPCIGNHETYPTNLFSVNHLANTESFLKAFTDSWKDIAGFNTQQIANITSGGFYSTLIQEGLRLIAFSSDYMYTLNWFNTLNARPFTRPSRPSELNATQTFLRNELEKAKANSEKVILLGHHPVGGADYIVRLSRWYQSLIIEYSDIIVLQPTGHTHNDEIRMIYNSTGHPVSVVLVSPSLSSGGTKNPSMRLFYLNKTDFSLVDYEQYFFSLGNSMFSAQAVDDVQDKEQAADNTDITEQIILLYSAKDAYGMPDLSPQSWDILTDRFASDRSLLLRSLSYVDATAKKRYFCSPKCQHNYICRWRNADFDSFKECKASFTGDTGDSTETLPDYDTETTNEISTDDGNEAATSNGTPSSTTAAAASTTAGGASTAVSCCNYLFNYLLALWMITFSGVLSLM